MLIGTCDLPAATATSIAIAQIPLAIFLPRITRLRFNGNEPFGRFEALALPAARRTARRCGQQRERHCVTSTIGHRKVTARNVTPPPALPRLPLVT